MNSAACFAGLLLRQQAFSVGLFDGDHAAQALAYAFVGDAQQQALAGFYLVAQPCQLCLHANAHQDVFLLHLFFRQRSPGGA